MVIALTIARVFSGTLLGSCFGFGMALLSMPLLTTVWGLEMATPLQALVGITSAMMVTGTSWRQIRLQSVWRLLVGACGGIPIGIMGLRSLPDLWMLRGLGGLLISYSVYRLGQFPLPHLHHPRWAYLFGFLSGLLGGAYNTSGPPVVLHSTMQGWSPSVFRATLQGYFFLAGSMTVIGHGFGGLWTPSMFSLYLWCLPGIIGGVALGHALNQRFSPQRFHTVLLALLVGLGLMLIVTAGR
ncbi:MAG: sulfite exporter TauE/SafE family protein [Leptolyngbyaceae cyanobacterium]